LYKKIKDKVKNQLKKGSIDRGKISYIII